MMKLDKRTVARNIFKTMRSLREGADLVLEEIREFVPNYIEFDPLEEDPAGIREWWRFCSLRSDLLERAVALNIRFSNGRLRVSAKFIDDANVIADVVGLLYGIFRFRGFSGGRWISSGRTGQTLVASTSVGLDTIVRCILANPEHSDYYIHCYSCFTVQTRCPHDDPSKTNGKRLGRADFM